ncbi:Uncharacterised protein [Streptococcus pneumoniae]|uniref:hypothetical protein n=1 Tax=Bacillus thuringiensis TaxID=1428 RepID=UPI0002411AB5|nr:hypothetical protein HMPREF1014_01722 [Bacillus sp. 7_6_55CFAA_CT2]EJQ10578.1 hypothetical protein IE1_02336 [Bacillus cereus BAG3O-2]EJQ26040.1 hypothetical protein IE7_02999 [Bacillus cereus BAG4O-1]KFL74660.1 hypothetical protein DJ50_278 [Bacillus cereus ATCC 10876]CGG58949.1 Uncharacterised protein [Streptococcus pneumoniae]SUU99673.1 Uncharacterised protein [Bacillus cereus]
MIKSMMFKMRQLFLITIDTRISTIYINDSSFASYEFPEVLNLSKVMNYLKEES